MKRDLAKGIGMILLAALLTCLGQLAWKLAAEADSLSPMALTVCISRDARRSNRIRWIRI